MRKRMKRGMDRKVFAKSADHVKAINIAPKVQRGGIRL